MSRTIGFSIAEQDVPRLDRLVAKFGDGNRSAFLREAMRQMEVLDRAERLQRVQREVSAKAVEKGIGPDDVNAVVKRVLAARRK